MKWTDLECERESGKRETGNGRCGPGSGPGFELQTDGVDAVAETGRSRTVRKNMAEMRTAAGAGDFRADHAVAAVFVFLDGIGRDGTRKAGPSASRIVFVAAVEKLCAAADASIDAITLEIVIFACKSGFRAFHPAHLELKGSKLLSPLLFRFDDLLHDALLDTFRYFFIKKENWGRIFSILL